MKDRDREDDREPVENGDHRKGESCSRSTHLALQLALFPLYLLADVTP